MKVVLFLLTAAVVFAAGPPYAITNAKIVVSDQATIPQGTIVMRDGLIEAVGPNIGFPADARVFDAKGLTVYPGLIDGATNYGFRAPAPGPAPIATPVPDEEPNSPDRYLRPKAMGMNADWSAASRMTIPAQPDARRNAGFTTVLSIPGEGYWQGTSALVNLAGTAGEAVVVAPVAMHVAFPSVGSSSGPTPGARRYPTSLMGVLAALRQSLITAKQYGDAVKLYEGNARRGLVRPKFDPISAALLPVLERKIPVMFQADSAEQIRRAIRFSDEFNLRPVILGGFEAWRVAELLNSRRIPVLVSLSFPNDSTRVDAESNPGRLEKAGVTFALVSSSPELVRTAMSRGLSRAAALRALTISPAEILGARDQLGTVETGKIANLTMVEGELFEEKTRVRNVVIDGQFYAPSAEPASRAVSRQPATPLPVRRPPEPEPASKDVVIQNTTILTVTNGTIENGSIWIEDGKIKAAGKTVTAPATAKRIDGTGRFVMPGIIDSHSHMAMSGGVNEGGPSVTAHVRVTDVLDPEDIDLYRAVAAGVTTLNILHGSANAIGGQNAVVKVKYGRPVEEMLFPGAPRGIKMALGENPKRSNSTVVSSNPRFPATRMGVENVIRESFLAAREYARTWNDYRARAGQGAKALEPERNLTLETLADVLAGKILVHAHCYRADEISMLLDLADEFGFKIRSLQHVLEGYKVADKIKRHGAGASTFADNWGYKWEAFDGTAYNAALLVKAGVRTAVNSDSDERARRMYHEAAKAMKYGGITENQALRLITTEPAWMLGIEKRVGAIEPGMDADLAIFNAHPFSAYTRVEMTIIDGQVVFDRERDLKQRIPWKEEFEPERESRQTPTDGEERHE